MSKILCFKIIVVKIEVNSESCRGVVVIYIYLHVKFVVILNLKLEVLHFSMTGQLILYFEANVLI